MRVGKGEVGAGSSFDFLLAFVGEEGDEGVDGEDCGTFSFAARGEFAVVGDDGEVFGLVGVSDSFEDVVVCGFVACGVDELDCFEVVS